jgi:hypothetical protein
MAKSQNVKPLQGVVATAEVTLSSELKGQNVEVQPVTVRATLDKTGRTDKQDYKGYMMHFSKLNKVVPINAGDILALEEKSGKKLFEKTDKGLVLNHFFFGINDGRLVIEG